MNFKIQGRRVGEGAPVFIIAELSANHRHKFELAVESIRKAKECGADAIKLQTYTADTITIDCDNECFRIKHGTIWDGKTLHELYREAYTPWDWQPKLKRIAEGCGLICFSSPFDPTAVDFLEDMGVPAYKVASFEITDLPLIRKIAVTGKPVIISTGIAGPQDIEEAVGVCRTAGNDAIALLKCTSAYPAPLDEVNLRAIPALAERFKAVPGLSDHTLGISVPMAAVALGARIIEKHFILDRKLGGPDAAFSLDPQEFGEMVKAVRDIEKALGEPVLELTPKGREGRAFARSLFVIEDVKEGESFSAENVRSIRPGSGLPPKHLDEVIGKKARRNIPRGTPLGWEMVAR